MKNLKKIIIFHFPPSSLPLLCTNIVLTDAQRVFIYLSTGVYLNIFCFINKMAKIFSLSLQNFLPLRRCVFFALRGKFRCFFFSLFFKTSSDKLLYQLNYISHETSPHRYFWVLHFPPWQSATFSFDFLNWTSAQQCFKLL